MTTLDPVEINDPHVPAHNAEREAINALQDAMPTKIPFPVSPTLGSMLRWDGDKYAASKMRIFEGNGTPEGVISAPPGSRYLDANLSSGVAEWIKSTGSGTTGWLPLNGDTGWQTIAPGTGFAHSPAGTAQARMINDVVYFRGAMRRTSGTGMFLGTLPAGMAPSAQINCHVRHGTFALLYCAIATGINLGSTSANTFVSNTDVWLGSLTGAPYKRT